MNFDDAKENIQPLATGRNASVLQASLLESPESLLAHRRELEQAIHNYRGDDPLEPWYAYISWIEQSFPSGGKESGLEEVLTKCLSRFEAEERYYQDRRMIKLYMKFIDSHQHPTECYQQLFNAGIGTMVADFYICWAYHYDLSGNTRKADEIFRQGISCRAEPLEELREAHQHFGFSVAQRLMYKDDEDVKLSTNKQLEERRLALTSLRGHRRKAMVGSIRTGAAVKSFGPGVVQSEAAGAARPCNSRVAVFKDENATPNISIATVDPVIEPLAPESGKSVIRSIIDAARNQENLKEPGPWNKAHDKNKSGKLFGKSARAVELGFNILEDDANSNDEMRGCYRPLDPPITAGERNYDKPFKYPANFKSKNLPLPAWQTPVTIESQADARTVPGYNKCLLYPRPNMEFQPEELRAYYWFKRRNLNNDFTAKRDEVWRTRDANANVRQYPNFAKQSKPQKRDALDAYYEPEHKLGLKVPFSELYDSKAKEEFQWEELLAKRLRRNETIATTADMEETVCLPAEQVARRKSFFPIRKSIVPKAMGMNKDCLMEGEKKEEKEQKLENNKSKRIVREEEIKECETNANKGANTDGLMEEKQSNKEFENLFDDKVKKLPSPQASTVELKKDEIFVAAAASSAVHFQIFEDTKNSPPGVDEPATAAGFPFQIYEDTTTNFPPIKSKPIPFEVVENNDFQFKAPAAPKSQKIPFEIYTEEEPATADAPGIFEETCSTQTFNIFLKSQSVSTPKMAQKIVPRSFGAIPKTAIELSDKFKEESRHTTSPAELAKMPDNVHEQEKPTAQTRNPPADSGAAPENVLSPIHDSPLQQKQLSTILETSEHATTQGTHTTVGASTKSTISSPEAEQLELQAPAPTKAPLEPLLERSSECSSTVSLAGALENLKLHKNVTKAEVAADVSQKQLKLPSSQMPVTPSDARLLHGVAINFSIYTDDHTANVLKSKQGMGNFSRLDEREDTAAGIAVRSIRFQEDKTDTISKMLLHSKQEMSKFQDDKTETIPKLPAIRFEEDTTGTIPRMALAPPAISMDDSFEFFGATPPPKHKLLKTQAKDSLDFMHTPSPQSGGSKAKRFCEQNTPIIQMVGKSKEAPPLFEDELEGAIKPQATGWQSNKKPVLKSISRDSFLPDFSLIEETQPQSAAKAAEVMPPPKQSFLLDYSEVMDSQPLKAPVTQPSKSNLSTSYLKDFSLIMDTQQQQKKTELPSVAAKSLLEASYLKDFSLVKETQPLAPQEEAKKKDSSVILDSQLLPKLSSNWRRQPNANQQQTTTNLTSSYLKDFSAIITDSQPKAQASSFADFSMKDLTMPEKATHTPLKFLNESRRLQESLITAPKDITSETRTEINRPMTKLSFLNTSKVTSNADKSTVFELNAATDMFATNNSMIKNSTWLPQCAEQSQLRKQSLHIKAEPMDLELDFKKPFEKVTAAANTTLASKSMQNASTLMGNTTNNASKNCSKMTSNETQADTEEPDDDAELSIYYKQTPKTPTIQQHIWSENSPSPRTPTQNNYVHSDMDLNQTHQIIEHICVDPNVNPFNSYLLNAFLDQIDFSNYIDELPNCQLVGHVSRLQTGKTVAVNKEQFVIQKLVGEGAYGAVYCGLNKRTGTKYALKQERPPNFWEYYICLEVQSRLNIDEKLPAFMSIDYALIGNNASILISPFSTHGSLINVCNKVKKFTMKNVDEYVVMLLACELLDIIDHLHAVHIIHADIKADNFLLMKKLTYPASGYSLQLIDFGVSIDMKLFKPNQTFNYVHHDNAFKCVEMREKRPWSYQLDLYGLAGVIHVLLFGKYMDISQRANGSWMHKTHVPRYFHKSLWESVFETLLNIRDCTTMPNLQQLRALIKEEIIEKEAFVERKVNDFNMSLSA